jgi:phytoene dehydrogenase-like protein
VGGAGVARVFATLLQQFGNNLVQGGMRNLPLALAGFVEAHGGEIRTSARIEKIRVENGKAVAVRLAEGTSIDVGTLVASSVDPQQLALGMLGEDLIGSAIARDDRWDEQQGARRPIPETGRYKSPVSNVYLCGSGSHPGGGVSMAPGRNAARVICHDLALPFPAG